MNYCNFVVQLLFILCLSQYVWAEEVHYDGVDQVTAAVALDHRHFTISNLEDNVLRVYRQGEPSPVHLCDVSAFLEAKDKPVEIVGAARIGDRIYWIGSFSRDNDGNPIPERHCFFATSINQQAGKVRLEPVGKPYKTLLKKLPSNRIVTTLRLDSALGTRKPLTETQQRDLAPNRSGLRIEAIAADPRLGILFIGFRNPRPIRVLTGRPHALMIPLNNPADVVEKGKNPIFGEATLWDFDDLGISGFMHSRVHGAYYIVAQAHNGSTPSVLYRWSGMKAISPERVKDLDASAVSLMAWGKTDKLLLLTGCGKARYEKQFRATWLRP